METAKNPGKVFCPRPEHEDQEINMIDGDPSSKRSLYCCLCLVEHHSQLPKTLKTIKAYIHSTSEAFEQSRKNLQTREEAPPEFADQISKKAESLEKLTKNLNQQKSQLKIVFDNIREHILNIIQEKENKYAQTIDNELKAACALYEEFERIFTTGWPKMSDLDKILPPRSEIELKLSKASDVLQLESVLQGLKEQVKVQDIFAENYGRKEENLKNFIKSLKNIDTNPPTFDLTELNLQKIADELKKSLDQLLDRKVKTLNKIPKSLSSSGSTFLQSKDMELLRSWVPKKYNSDWRLLYKSSVDGKTPSDFHRKCDGKGPTLTIIKCRFDGLKQSKIIGGFSNQDWHSRGDYTHSNEAFIFSLLSQIKCPVVNASHATYGHASYGPTFGAGFDILIHNGMSQGISKTASYSAMIDIPNNAKFSTEEIEVYSISLAYS